MIRSEFNIWLKEHNNKCSIKQLREIGLILQEVKDLKKWVDSEGVPCLIGYVDTDDEELEFTVQEYSVVEPVQPPKTEEVLKNMEKYLDCQHYETINDYSSVFSNKKWYDKFYEHKGRKYRK